MSQESSSSLKLIGNTALELIWPTRCSGCESLGTLLCSSCDSELLRIAREHACARCGAPFGQLICTECYSGEGEETHEFAAAVCALELDELSGRITVLYKDSNEHRLSQFFAGVLITAVPESWLGWAQVLTWIPADKKAMRKRGFDHMKRIALDVASRVELPTHQLLNKQPCLDQRKLNRKQRKENLQRSFSLAQTNRPVPQRILLIDDVLTTGSTLDAATLKLKEGGASEVRVACIARAW